jgi:hypothetical protein
VTWEPRYATDPAARNAARASWGDLERTLARGLRWWFRTRVQPAGAPMSHHGIQTVVGPWAVQIAHERVIVLSWAGRFAYKAPPKIVHACPSCSHGEDVFLAKSRTIGAWGPRLNVLVGAVLRREGAKIVQAWNGGQSKSIGFGFSREPSRAVLRMLKVYADGCQSTTHPDQGDGQRGQRAAAHYAGTVFCNRWWREVPRPRLPKGWN